MRGSIWRTVSGWREGRRRWSSLEDCGGEVVEGGVRPQADPCGGDRRGSGEGLVVRGVSWRTVGVVGKVEANGRVWKIVGGGWGGEVRPQAEPGWGKHVL